MIINTGSRTDIPAYYAEWFYKRIEEGYALTRNPYRPEQVLRYRLSSDVVDVLSFCTKNPAPMLARLSELSEFRQFWQVTITPYGREIEPGVPDKETVMESAGALAAIVGKAAVSWRYDPIFITEKYSVPFHIETFEKMAAILSGSVNACVISFIDLYQKTRRNFPQAKEVTAAQQEVLVQGFVGIGKQYGIPIRTCCEDPALSRLGADVSGCMTQEVIERSLGIRLTVPHGKKHAREGCSCLLGSDIGMYNTCPHGCLYCYANYDRRTVSDNFRRYDPASPFLIGGFLPGDKITEPEQVSWIDEQLRLF